MFGHDDYEEIAAAASRGEATAEELAAFQKHARQCASCRAAYAAFLEFAALEFALRVKSAWLPKVSRGTTWSQGV